MLLMAKLFANSEDPDQMLHSAMSDLDLHCLPVTLLGVSQLQWVKLSLKANSVDGILKFFFFSWKIGLTFCANCLTICKKCQPYFQENISKSHLLKVIITC